MKYRIPYNTNPPSKTYETTPDEEMFIDRLLEKSKELKGNYSLSRMSDGTINVSYNSYPIGKVKLRGRKPMLMYMKNLYDPISVYGDFYTLVAAIDFWILYIKKYLKCK